MPVPVGRSSRAGWSSAALGVATGGLPTTSNRPSGRVRSKNASTSRFLLLGGRLADLLGRRRILVIGAAVFTAASLACALAGSAGMLVAARVVEGLGAAMTAPAALSLILAMFPEGPERNKALGAFGAVSGAGGAIGVLAGGMLTTWLSWPSIFFVNLPVGALIVVGARPLLLESRAHLGHRRFDVAGAVTVTGGLSVLVYTVVTAGSHGWASTATIGLLAGAAALLAAFVVIEAGRRRRGCRCRFSATAPSPRRTWPGCCWAG